jgi:hypothetical protein
MATDKKTKRLALSLAELLDKKLANDAEDLAGEIEQMSDAEVAAELQAIGADIEGFEARVKGLQTPSAALLTEADVVRFVRDPDFHLSHAQQRELFGNSKLREIFKREKSGRRHINMPVAAAAASAIPLRRRPIDGGWIDLIPSTSNVAIVNVVLTSSEPLEWSNATMLIENDQLGVFKLTLPPSGGEQEFQTDLDMRIPLHNSILEALASPLSEGEIIID